jgi:hypothetical protein
VAHISSRLSLREIILQYLALTSARTSVNCKIYQSTNLEKDVAWFTKLAVTRQMRQIGANKYVTVVVSAMLGWKSPELVARTLNLKSNIS